MSENSGKLEHARENFIQGAGRIASSLMGVLNKVCGQIYGLLLLSKDPLSLDDIMDQLKVSKGNVSINIRILEDYKLVKKVWVKGSRKDYYLAVGDLPVSVIKEFFDKIHRNIQDSLDMTQDSLDLAEQAKKENKSEEAHFIVERLALVKSFYQAANYLFEAIYSGKKVETALLQSILK